MFNPQTHQQQRRHSTEAMIQQHEPQPTPSIPVTVTAAANQNHPPDASSVATTTTTMTSTTLHHRRRHHKHLHQHHHQRQRRGGRLWQLPESSIDGYAKWIEEKPSSEQTVSEQKFLWKFQRRVNVRQNKRPKERMQDYVARLEQKEERTPVEDRLIQQFHRRRAKRTGKGIPPPMFWKRNRKKPPAASSVLTLSSNMASLRECMNKLGLSSDKLRDVNMEDDSKK